MSYLPNGNEKVTLVDKTFSASETFTSDWYDVAQFQSILVVAFTDTASVTDGATVEFADVEDDEIVWGADTTLADPSLGGINVSFHLPIRGRFFRVRYTHGAAPGRVYASLCFMGEPTGLPVYQIAFPLDEEDEAVITRSILVRQDPDGDFINQKQGGVHPDLSTDTPLAGDAVFTSDWVNVEGFLSVGAAIKSDVAGAEEGIEVQFSRDESTVTRISKFTYTNIGFADFISTPVQDKFARLVYTNGSTAQSTFILHTTVDDTVLGPDTLTVRSTITDDSIASLTKSVNVGQQPDGDYVNVRADGALFEETNTLGPAASFETDWFDTDGWVSIELHIKTDQVSDSDGIVIEFTRDTDPGTPSVDSAVKFTFNSSAVSAGELTIRIPAKLDGVRFRYTNGGVSQGDFLFTASVHTASVESPQSGVEVTLGPTSSAIQTRGIVNAKNDAGDYGNVLRGDSGGLRTSVNEFERQVPISPLTAFETNGTSVPGTAVQIATGLNANTKTISIKTRTSNSKVIYIGPNSAVTTANGYPLAAGDAVELEVNENTEIWAISASGTQDVHWLAVNTHEDPAT